MPEGGTRKSVQIVQKLALLKVGDRRYPPSLNSHQVKVKDPTIGQVWRDIILQILNQVKGEFMWVVS